MMRSLDLPLEQTAVSRFLPWIMAGLLYLSLIALAVAAVADGALQLFDQRSKLVTVTLPTVADRARSDQELAAILDILKAADEVAAANPVASDEIKELIEPWLGDARASDGNLALPRLIDVTLDPLVSPDLKGLQDRLRTVVPEATIGIQAVSHDRAERQATFFRTSGIALGVVLVVSALIIVGLITHLSLAMHNDTVQLLRYMGAQDGYLARQFERFALVSGLRGGLMAFIAAMLTVLILLYSIQHLELTSSIRLGLRPIDWIMLACVPVVCALLCTATARIIALWGLTRMA
jgi:cell division transport system permease protein